MSGFGIRKLDQVGLRNELIGEHSYPPSTVILLMPNPIATIGAKRNRQELTPSEIHELVVGFVSVQIPGCQVSALLMSIYLGGVTAAETIALTSATDDSDHIPNGRA